MERTRNSWEERVDDRKDFHSDYGLDKQNQYLEDSQRTHSLAPPLDVTLLQAAVVMCLISVPQLW